MSVRINKKKFEKMDKKTKEVYLKGQGKPEGETYDVVKNGDEVVVSWPAKEK